MVQPTSASANDNYYDIMISNANSSSSSLPSSSPVAGAKKKFHSYSGPRRIGSQSSLPTLSESTVASSTRRPGDYYIQKLSSSSINLPKSTRPPSAGDSIVALNSNYSDEICAINSNFDPTPDSRLSSMTSNSDHISNESSMAVETIADKLSSSISTITLKDKQQTQIFDSTQTVPRVSKRSVSTSQLPHNKPPSLKARANSTSTLGLTRTKTKYISPPEIKKRQQLRKKAYDDSCNEDEILLNDLDLVFNVPIIKSESEVHLTRKNSIRRTDLIDDSHYNKPFPLPGKLSSTSSISLSINTSLNDAHTSTPHNGTILQETSFDSDNEITDSITNHYTQRSLSYNKMIKSSREDVLLYKLPNYIKSQSSLDDLALISPEKLSIVDQSRPINLPPKTHDDKQKHNREFRRILSDYELNFKQRNELIKRHSGCDDDVANKWENFVNDKNFNLKKILGNKNAIRKLNWDSNCPSHLRYTYFCLMLNLDQSKSAESYNNLNAIYENLNESIKSNRRMQFEAAINTTLQRPLYQSIIKSLGIKVDKFKKDLMHLLFLKSLSSSGLAKHEEIFLIPMFLILFRDEPLPHVLSLTEAYSKEIFDVDFIMQLNKSLGMWSAGSPKSVASHFKRVKLDEFENFNFNSFIEILLQFNDKLPLSLSAPTTPILALSSELPLSSSSCSLNLIGRFLQLLLVYSVSHKTKIVNNMKIFSTFAIIVFKYYHINWNTFVDLIKFNRSIKLNFHLDNQVNLSMFTDKWKDVYQSF